MNNSNLFKALFLIAVFSLSSCGGEKKTEEKIVRPVQYQEVGFLGGEKIRTFNGTAKTDKIINLSFRNNGIITEFNIRLGQEVKKGQLLAKLDNVQSRLAYQQAVSSLNSAASQMNTAKLSLDRTRSLYEKGSASLSDFESAKNSYRTALASHESQKRSVDIQQEQIRYGYLYAPEDGVIASVSAEIDENVTPGQNIAVLNAGTDMEISLGLPESVINRVKQGMNVTIDFSSLAGKQFNGRVTEVAPAVDASTSTYLVRIIVTDPSEEIKTGMAANVTFDFGDGESTANTLVVPAKSVGEDGSGQFVFLIEGDEAGNGVVKKQYVDIGELTSEGFEIKSGLSAGQKIATAGLQTLLDGQEVRLQ
ncbi:efflux RND transporter periplasmic adaptor subunit [Leptobacterium flavescens]|uniref:Efflux RND transporter periplasmic adaptor subunit n=1 Tax=Leptobacterium flavescens TaxID=472055 RepID=A0A6P0ULZ9_9FLAO|nr:efflux RND transporter periplasmic adaptor subunit [Leptobacterium flavescens]NER12888.1 efflux RND transporter periplasmic adaptor subunit [Leptobacterium flavescens]